MLRFRMLMVRQDQLFSIFETMNVPSPLEGFVPDKSIVFCEELRKSLGFDLKIKAPRQTRFGDFRAYPTGQLLVTVNANLNPYHFLVTYLHEVAHCMVYIEYKLCARRPRHIKPHGEEWRSAFRGLLHKALLEDFFPAELVAPLRTYAQSPAASTVRDQELYQALQRFNTTQVVSSPPISSDKVKLSDLQEGETFVLKERVFTRKALRRTRVLCVAHDNRALYTISAATWVEPAKKAV